MTRSSTLAVGKESIRFNAARAPSVNGATAVEGGANCKVLPLMFRMPVRFSASMEANARLESSVMVSPRLLMTAANPADDGTPLSQFAGTLHIPEPPFQFVVWAAKPSVTARNSRADFNTRTTPPVFSHQLRVPPSMLGTYWAVN